MDTTYAVIRFNIDDSGRMVLADVLAQNLDDKANALIFRKTYSRVKAQEGSWLIIVTIDVSEQKRAFENFPSSEALKNFFRIFGFVKDLTRNI